MGRASVEAGQAFHRQVVELAHLYGWTVAHFRTVRLYPTGRHATPVAEDGAGFPDLLLVHECGLGPLYRELKAGAGRLEPDQLRWSRLLLGAGADWSLWRDNLWDVIRAEISAPTRRRA